MDFFFLGGGGGCRGLRKHFFDVRVFKRAAFTPLVFAATSGAGKLTNGLVESALGFQSAAVSHSLPQELAPKGIMRSG